MKKWLFILAILVANQSVMAEDAGGYDPSIEARREAAARAQMEEQLKAERKAAVSAEKKRKLAREKAESNRIIAKLEKDKATAPEYLKGINEPTLCVLYGKAVRGEMGDTDRLSFDGAADMVKNEVKRRNLNLNYELAKNASLKIGMSIADMYAAMGYPERNNRTVDAHGVHIQHVYDNWRTKGRVYTDNGIVTSWQD
jgi:hypothetical protein